MPKLILRHFKLPFSIVWLDPEDNWDKCQKMLREEISTNGFEGFRKMETANEPDSKSDDMPAK